MGTIDIRILKLPYWAKFFRIYRKTSLRILKLNYWEARPSNASVVQEAAAVCTMQQLILIHFQRVLMFDHSAQDLGASFPQI